MFLNLVIGITLTTGTILVPATLTLIGWLDREMKHDQYLEEVKTRAPLNRIGVPHIPKQEDFTLTSMVRTSEEVSGEFLNNKSLRNHSFSTYGKFSAKLTFLLLDTPIMCVSGSKNVSFAENFSYVLNNLSLNNSSISVKFLLYNLQAHKMDYHSTMHNHSSMNYANFSEQLFEQL